MSRELEELQQESEEHRARIAALVDELRDHVTPGEIANQLLGRDAGREIVHYAGYQLGRQLRSNPVPVALIGFGMAWLLLANGMRGQRRVPLHDGLDYDEYRAVDGHVSGGILGGARRVIRQLTGNNTDSTATYFMEQENAMSKTITEKHNGSSQLNGNGSGDEYDSSSNSVEDNNPGFVGRTVQKGQRMATDFANAALHKSGEAVSGAKEAVANTASSLMERTNEMARKTGRAATTTANRAGTGIGQLAREQPLLVAGVGFALGVALGALLPLTRAENELLGEQAERLKDSAKELASEGYERVKSVAQKSYEAATETLKNVTDNQGTGGNADPSSSQASGSTYGSEQGGNTASGSYSH